MIMERHSSFEEHDRPLSVEWFQGAWRPPVLIASIGGEEGALGFAPDDSALPLGVGEMLTLYRRGVVSYSDHAPVTRSIALPAGQLTVGEGRGCSLRDDSITRIRF